MDVQICSLCGVFCHKKCTLKAPVNCAGNQKSKLTTFLFLKIFFNSKKDSSGILDNNRRIFIKEGNNILFIFFFFILFILFLFFYYLIFLFFIFIFYLFLFFYF